MPHRSRLTCPLTTALVLLGACSFDSDGHSDAAPPPGPDPSASVLVRGSIVDIESGTPVDADLELRVEGIVPAPAVLVNGSNFSLEAPANSVFHIVSADSPDLRRSYNAAIEVGTDDIDTVELFAISERFLTGMADEFGLNKPVEVGVIVARALDAAGAPYAGLPGDAFDLPPNVAGPFFLDGNRQPDANLAQTSSSGFVVFFDVAPGLTSIASQQDADVAVSMPGAPVNADAVTFVSLRVDEAIDAALPETVSFSEHVLEALERRGCTNCHDGTRAGNDLGGLRLNGAPSRVYNELLREPSPIDQRARVDLESPAESLLLTLPAAEDPPDRHPFSTFSSDKDRDYALIYRWIQQGALRN